MKKYIIGVDGGGTYIRGIIVNMEGRILASYRTAGIHPEKNLFPKENLETCLTSLLDSSALSFADIKAICIGMAGMNDAGLQKKWIDDMTDFIPPFVQTFIVNDAVVAHYGAFIGEDGIIGIAGTGSIVLGKKGDTMCTNFDFSHNSRTGARYLTLESLFTLILNQTHRAESDAFTRDVLAYFHVNSLLELIELMRADFKVNSIEKIQLLSIMAPLVTRHAKEGNTIAIETCRLAAHSLAQGIQLVTTQFNGPVQLAFIGSVATDAFIQQEIKNHLFRSGQEYLYVKPKLLPVVGAVLYAREKLGLETSTAQLVQLKSLEVAQLYTSSQPII